MMLHLKALILPLQFQKNSTIIQCQTYHFLPTQELHTMPSQDETSTTKPVSHSQVLESILQLPLLGSLQ